MDNFSTLRKCLVYEMCLTGSQTIAKRAIRLDSHKAILHVFIRTSA